MSDPKFHRLLPLALLFGLLCSTFAGSQMPALAEEPGQKDAAAAPEQTKPPAAKQSIESDDDLDKEELKAASGKRSGWFGMLKHGPSFWKLKYYFAAQNAEDCEFFYGLIQDNPLIGRASVDFNNANGCKCHGVAQVTHYPLKGGVVGQRGYIKVKCEDGRKMHGHFTTTSLTTGYADLTDNLGHKYESTFGHTAEEAIVKINTIRKKLGCPEVTAEDVEMKVNGHVIVK